MSEIAADAVDTLEPECSGLARAGWLEQNTPASALDVVNEIRRALMAPIMPAKHTARVLPVKSSASRHTARKSLRTVVKK